MLQFYLIHVVIGSIFLRFLHFIHHSWDFPGTGLKLFYGYQTADVTCSISLNKKLPGGKFRIAAVYRNANGEWEPIPLLKGIQYDYINKLYGVMSGGPVTVYTLTGQPVMFIREWEGYNQLHQLNLPSGTYLLKQQNEVLKYLIY